MWNDKMKAVTFSYDDGVFQDVRLIEILDRYGLRGTFNINLARQKKTDTSLKSGILVKHLNACDLSKVYVNHEIAGHTYTHANLEKLEEDAIREEIRQCHDGLQQLTGRAIWGMAYPYGKHNDKVVEVLRKENVRYARTTAQTESFAIPSNLLRLPTTCRHANENLFDLAQRFIELKPSEPQLFFLWGHSYEFDEQNNWELMEEFCRIISGHSDIFYGTNSEVLLDLSQV